MKSISELKAELQDAKLQLRMASPVGWGSGGSGMTQYNDALTNVTRLTAELNRALKEGAS